MGRTIHGKRTKGGSTAKLTNNCCIFGIMGGTAPLTGKPLAHRAYLEKRASRKALCITDCAQGHQYLKDNQILGCNPQAGGVGNMWRHRHYSHRSGPTPEGDGSAHGSRGVGAIEKLRVGPSWGGEFELLEEPHTSSSSSGNPKKLVLYINAYSGGSTGSNRVNWENLFENLDIYFNANISNNIDKYVILTFWAGNTSADMNPFATAKSWSDYINDLKSEISDVEAYLKSEGKPLSYDFKIMVSAFGETPALNAAEIVKKSAKDYGISFGNFILENYLDGGDIDFEAGSSNVFSTTDSVSDKGTYMSKGSEWLCELTSELHSVLNIQTNSTKKYIISHAPQPPYFNRIYNSSYRDINHNVGHMIDFYNIQYYNQSGTFDHCYSVFHDSTKGNAVYDGNFVNAYGSIDQLHCNTEWIYPIEESIPNTKYLKESSVYKDTSGKNAMTFQLPGIPLEKIVLGKPILKTDATYGHWSPNLLQSSLYHNINKLSIGGVMGWALNFNSNGTISGELAERTEVLQWRLAASRGLNAEKPLIIEECSALPELERVAPWWWPKDVWKQHPPVRPTDKRDKLIWYPLGSSCIERDVPYSILNTSTTPCSSAGSPSECCPTPPCKQGEECGSVFWKSGSYNVAI